MKNVLLASGGLDSTTLAYWLLKREIEYIPLIINYGQHFFQTELNTLKEVLPQEYRNRIEVYDISDIYKGSSSLLIKEPDLWNDKVTDQDMHLPLRNVLLLAMGVTYAQTNGCHKLYSGFIDCKNMRELDCSETFFAQWDNMMNVIGCNVVTEMPFKYLEKKDVAKIGLDLGVPIGQTFSCQVSSRIPCGACPNCVDRLLALKEI